jgi:hypothetical protein
MAYILVLHRASEGTVTLDRHDVKLFHVFNNATNIENIFYIERLMKFCFLSQQPALDE